MAEVPCAASGAVSGQ